MPKNTTSLDSWDKFPRVDLIKDCEHLASCSQIELYDFKSFLKVQELNKKPCAKSR